MAIVLDSSTFATGDGSSGPAISYSHTLGSGDDRIVLVCVSIETDEADPIISSVTYGGVTMTELTATQTGATFKNRAGIYYLLDASLPAVGSNTVTINLPVTVGGGDVVISGCSSWIGCEQSAPTGAQNSSVSAEGTTTVTTTPTTDNAGSLVIGCVSTGDAVTLTPPTGYTEAYDATANSSSGSGWYKIETTGSTLLSLTTTASASVNRFCVASTSWNPSAAAASKVAAFQSTYRRLRNCF